MGKRIKCRINMPGDTVCLSTGRIGTLVDVVPYPVPLAFGHTWRVRFENGDILKRSVSELYILTGCPR